jgi:hypothetical protein
VLVALVHGIQWTSILMNSAMISVMQPGESELMESRGEPNGLVTPVRLSIRLTGSQSDDTGHKALCPVSTVW